VEQHAEILIGRPSGQRLPVWRDAVALVLILAILILLGSHNRLDPEFHNLVDELYSILTSRAAESIKAQSQIHGGLVQVLPPVGPHLIAAVIEAVAGPPGNGQSDLADIARLPGLRAKDLFAVAEVLHILEFAELKDEGSN
jgi:hypothetical protein